MIIQNKSQKSDSKRSNNTLRELFLEYKLFLNSKQHFIILINNLKTADVVSRSGGKPQQVLEPIKGKVCRKERFTIAEHNYTNNARDDYGRPFRLNNHYI
jgi:hypothetical protein